MKCEICGKKAEKNSLVCSDRCQQARLKILELGKKYFPTNGCDNCWGDLYQGCSEQCKREFSESGEFMKDLWSLIRVIHPKEDKV